MLESLKRKVMPTHLLGAALFLAATAVAGFFAVPNLLMLAQGPADLYELTETDFSSVVNGEKIYVTADIDTIYDYYAQTMRTRNGSSTGTVTSKEYLVPTNTCFIGVEVPAIMISDADAAMADTEKWLMDTDGSYEWDGSYISVRGTLRLMDEETTEMYYDLLRDYYDMTDDEMGDFLPIVLVHGDIGSMNQGALIMVSLGMLVLLGLGIWELIGAFTGRSLKQIRRYCAAQLDSEGAQHSLDQLYEQTPETNGYHLDRNWLLCSKSSGLWALMTSDIVWIYQSTTTHRTNGIRTGTSYAVTVCSKSEPKKTRRHTLPVKNEAMALEVIADLHQYIPDAVYGYSPE